MMRVKLETGLAVVAVGVILFLCALAGAQSCAPAWANGVFSTPALSGPPEAFAQYDADGPGPAPAVMVAGGTFGLAGGIPAGFIAQWDGSHWAPLGGGLSGIVTSLAVFDEDGGGPGLPHLYAAGGFWLADGQAAQGIARWDGTAWSSIGTLAPLATDTRLVMCVADDDGPGPHPISLFVGSHGSGGGLTSAGGVSVQGLARWDGTSWHAVPGLTAGLQVSALAVIDDGAAAFPQLVAAGYVLGGGFTATTAVARWNGSAWTVQGSLVLGVVRDLAVYDTDGLGPNPPALFLGGSPNVVGPVSVLPFARYSAGDWTAVPVTCGFLGNGCSGNVQVNDLLVFDEDGGGPAASKLLVAGIFNGTPSGGFVASTIDGVTLAPVAANPLGGAGVFLGTPGGAGVRALGSFDPAPGASAPRLFAGGVFSAAEVSCSNFAAWTGAGWSSPGQGLEAQVTALAPFDSDGAGPAASVLIAGGKFTIATAGGVARRVAAWNGETWSALGAGLDGAPSAFCSFDEDGAGPLPPRLFAGGQFAVGIVTNVARWDGSSWTYSSNAPTAGSTCTALTAFDDDGPGPNPESLYAAIADTVTFSTGAVLRWNGGSSWTQIAAASGPVWDLLVFDEDGGGPQPPVLCAGGAFATIGGAAAQNVARWDGIGWTPIGAAPAVTSMVAFDGDGPGGQPARLHLLEGGGIHAWDGASWLSVGSPGSGFLRTLRVHDADGDGPAAAALYAGGTFSSIGGVAASCVASFDGASWSPLGTGIPAPPSSGGVWAIASARDRGFPALFVGGTFSSAGGFGAGDLARWSVEAGLSLGFAPAGPNLVIQNSSCRPGASYFSAFSTDSLNSSQPGGGWWAGLFIDFTTILDQYALGAPPFLGTLDPAGASAFVLDAGIQAALSGITIHAVTRTYDPALLAPLDASNVASHQF